MWLKQLSSKQNTLAFPAWLYAWCACSALCGKITMYTWMILTALLLSKQHVAAQQSIVSVYAVW